MEDHKKTRGAAKRAAHGRRPTEVASPPIELVGVTPSRTRSGRSAPDYHVPELPLMSPLDDGRRPAEVASPPIELV